MFAKLLISAFVATGMAAAPAHAGDTGAFVGLDATIGWASGSSDTTDGGAPFAGGGVVESVDFGVAYEIGGHIGYRFNYAFSAFVSYRYIRGDVNWGVDFPLFGVASQYEGTAVTNAVMVNAAYDFAVAERTSLGVTGGAGLSFNRLTDIVETDVGTGLFLADVAGDSRASPMARIGIGIEHRISPTVALGLNASLGYGGKFRTGTTRSGNLGVTPINPYEIGGIWRGNLGASIRFRF